MIDTNLKPNDSCPCKSGAEYQSCCYPVIEQQSAQTPEQLMRSRFTAFATNNSDYLQASWHADNRPQQLSLDDTTQWKHLEILDTKPNSQDILKNTQPSINEGWVTFRAIFFEPNIESGQWQALEETSRFLREENKWLYHSGMHEISILKPQRNDTCPCGSGKKFKKCCLLGH